MNTTFFSKRLLLVIIGVLLGLFLGPKACGDPMSEETATPKITIERDTVWQTKIDTFKVQTLKYQTVYVDRDEVASVQTVLPETTDSTQYREAKVYRDTLSNDDLDVFSYHLVEGQLLDSEISYRLKVPREITVTKTIEHPQTSRSGLFLFSEIGGNQTRFDNLSLGLQYNHKGRWFVSYRVNMNQFPQPTHHIGVGLRLFK